MERTVSLLSVRSSRSSSLASLSRYHEPLLPLAESVSEKQQIKVRSVLSHCLYRRVLIWTVASLVLVSVVLFKASNASVPNVVSSRLGNFKTPHVVEAVSPKAGHVQEDKNIQGGAVFVIVSGGAQKEINRQQGKLMEPASANRVLESTVNQEDEQTMKQTQKEMEKTPWLRFPHLDGYFHGLKTLVNKSDHIAEYPNPERQAPLARPPLNSDVPKPQPYNPYNSLSSAKPCYLDRGNKVPAPTLYAYDGVPQHMPDPSIGSYKVFGIRDDICFDRFGRYGPYGLGYSKEDGGTGAGMNTESSGNGEVWAESGQINYANMDWGDAQERCLAANKERFAEPNPKTDELKTSNEKKGRIAVVIRLYTGFKWTQHTVLNFRALVTELSLKSGGEYSVHFLLHVRDSNTPIWSDDAVVQKVLDSNVPREFHGLVTLWSESQMQLFYPGKFGDPMANPSNTGIHGVYRSAHLPLQVFAMHHPEYEHFWNWEMDMRFLGNYYELFDRLGRWADKQPRRLIWERSSRYYIPEHHGSWENFEQYVKNETAKSGKQDIFGPQQFPGKKPLRREERGESMLPSNCAGGHEEHECGVGEPADLITLNPIFDAESSGWVFANDVTGYTSEGSSQGPPRRTAIVTASRLSHRLLSSMHEEVWRNHHTMFTEMFPPSIALHHGLKAVYAPHPVYIDRAWGPLGSAVDAAFNGGQDHSTSGSGSPFNLVNEHNHKGTSWYYDSEFAGLLWRRWLGYAQLDGRGKHGGRAGQGSLRGGQAEEEGSGGSGRMCLRSMLVHPIKHENPTAR